MFLNAKSWPFATAQLLGWIEALLRWFGLGKDVSELFAQVAVCVLIVMMAWVANEFVKGQIVRWLRQIAIKTENKWDNYLVEFHVFERFSHLAPALLLHVSASTAFPHSPSLQHLLRRFVMVYIAAVVAWMLHSLINATAAFFSEIESTKDKPLDSYAQLVKSAIWLFACIIILSELLGRSPWALLGGLGAFTAILLLVFRDALLGFVASVQMTTLDLVRKGDWIEMPKFGVNGSVIDFSLTTIKIQNWDRTTSTVPSYAIISDTFKNWRGMSESGGRRIKRSLYLDMHSIRFLDAPLLKQLKKIELIQSYLDQKTLEVRQWNLEREVDESSVANGRRLTNFGTFRAYIDAYLRQHMMISQSMTFLVRQLEPGPEGIGLEIYVFSKEQRWDLYEGIIADIFDHLLAVLHIFELRVFQRPTGADMRAIGREAMFAQDDGAITSIALTSAEATAQLNAEDDDDDDEPEAEVEETKATKTDE